MELKGWSVERKGGGGRSLVIKLPLAKVPQCKPHSWAVNAIATDHKGTKESGASDQNSPPDTSTEEATGPVQHDRRSKRPTESFSAPLPRQQTVVSTNLGTLSAAAHNKMTVKSVKHEVETYSAPAFNFIH